MKNIEKIFSITNEYINEYEIYKVLTILGIKFKFRNHRKCLLKFPEISKEVKLLRAIVDKSIDITKIPPARGNLRIVQLLKTKMLELVDVILKENNICYWIDYGTLIGAIRHKGFVPWDDDIDICVLWKDYVKLPKILEQLKSINSDFNISYGLQGSELLRVRYKDFCVDIFPFSYTDKKYETEQSKMKFEKL